MSNNEPRDASHYHNGFSNPAGRISELEHLLEFAQKEIDGLRARVADLSNLCERLQHCAQSFYVDQGDYGHMEAIMKDYHWIMRASKPWRDAFISRVQADAVDRAAMNFGGRDYAEVRLGLSEWARSLRQQADDIDQGGA